MTLFYARFSGALPSGEIWNSGIHVSGIDTLADVLTAAGDAASAWWEGSGPTDGYNTIVNAATTLDDIVVYQLDGSTHKATARAEAAGPGAGTGSGSCLPQEVAVCATLRAAAPGPAGRGRMYLPSPLVSTILASSRLDATIQAQIAQNIADMIVSFQGNALTPVISSVGRADRTIISVDVGDVYDVQRRRRDKLVETRIQGAL